VVGRFESGVNPCNLPCGGRGRPGRLPVLVAGGTTEPSDQRVHSGRGEVRAHRQRRQYLRPHSRCHQDRGAGTQPDPDGRFDPTVQRWLKEINGLVAAAVGAEDWLTLAYEAPEETATIGSLFADRLRCLEFSFRLEVSFLQGQQKRVRQVSYSSDGTVIVDPDTDAKARIPVFGVSTSNKCRRRSCGGMCEGTDSNSRSRATG